MVLCGDHQDEVFLGGEGALSVPDHRLARLHHGFAPQIKALIAAAASGGAAASGNKDGDDKQEQQQVPAAASEGGVWPGGGEGAGPMAELLESALQHPACVNEASVRGGLSPSVNGLASARALARLMDALAGGGTKLLSRAQQAGMRRAAAATEDSPMFGRRRWAMGFQVSPETGVSQHSQTTP